MQRSFRLLVLAGLLLGAACSRPPPEAATPSARHEHRAPHGGTPVVLGAELYHLELVRDATGGRLRAYVLDGELENFVRIAAPAIELTVTVDGQSRPLVLSAVASPATGETVGDTSCFEGRADWLRATPAFEVVLTRIEIRGTTFTGIRSNFPRGNDRD
ncbi:MAG: hypothetical protein JSR48_06720 [Verrucomicrobia bacterium]|nr:hypothetical protein [Verrucomicrobiota bacterium]